MGEFEHKDLFPRLLSAVGPLMNITSGGNLFGSAAGHAAGDDADEPTCGSKSEKADRSMTPKNSMGMQMAPSVGAAAQLPQCMSSVSCMETVVKNGERLTLVL